MSSSDWIITSACLATIGVIGLLYLLGTLERARINRSIQIGEWQDRAHRLQQLLAAAPQNTLTPNVKQAGFLEIKRCLQALLKLDNRNNTAKRRLAEVNNALEQLPKEPPPTLKLEPIRSVDELKEIRRKLTDLFNFIHMAAKTRVMDVTTAKKELDILKKLYTEAGASFYLAAAKTEESQNKYRAALQHYKMSINEYKKGNINNIYKEPIIAIQNAVADIELRLAQEFKAAAEQAGANTNSALASAVDKWQAQGEELWHKKKF